ncbi:MAG: hypothetical protein P4N60_05430, partial [Verrucomicrobiae bacterium]|nr:hypothetical protein [Verrucomicrobiae bacterium]
NLLDAPPFTQCQNRMKHFLWNHKVTTLTAPPQLFQTFLPITNVEEATFLYKTGPRVRAASLNP